MPLSYHMINYVDQYSMIGIKHWPTRSRSTSESRFERPTAALPLTMAKKGSAGSKKGKQGNSDTGEDNQSKVMLTMPANGMYLSS